MNKKLIWAITIIIAVLVLLGFRFIGRISKDSSNQNQGKCQVTKEEVTVRGNSLSPFIKNGQTVEALKGYYKCYPVKRNDVVLFHYSGDKNPLIKMVKAVPGDQWSLRQGKDGYNIIVNNHPLANTEGKLYQIIGNRVKMLQLYTNDYPVIPKDTYLLLGNEPEGSLDSTRFGLIDKSDIVAKVNIPN